MLQNVIRIVKKRFNEGALYIFGSSVLSQLFGFLSSIIVIRFLEKATYGHYVTANNYYSYFAILIGLGFTSSVIQFCCETEDSQLQNAIYKYSLKNGSLFNIPIALLVFLFGFYISINRDYESGLYLQLMALLPFVVFYNNFLQIVLRIKLENKRYAVMNAIFSSVTIISNIILTRIIGTLGLIISTYLANIVSSIYASLLLKKDNFFTGLISTTTVLNKTQKNELVSYSLYCAITNFSSTLLVLLDITCLDIIIKESEILADYKVASTIPNAFLFISECLIVFYYPYIVKCKREGTKAFKAFLRKLLLLFSAVNFFVFIFLELFASSIIHLTYGEKYSNIVSVFRILGLNFFFVSSFKKLFGNVIAILKDVKINLIHSSIAGLLNIVLDVFMITRYGYIGAAISTTIVTVFIVILEVLFIVKRLSNNTLELDCYQ